MAYKALTTVGKAAQLPAWAGGQQLDPEQGENELEYFGG
jgi:hypothetical protein